MSKNEQNRNSSAPSANRQNRFINVRDEDILNVAFVLITGFSHFALSCVSEPLRVANRLSGQTHYRFCFVSVDGMPVIASNGQPTYVNHALAECPSEFNVFIVVAGFDPLSGPVRAIISGLHGKRRKGARLGGIDTGAMILAEAGLLNGRKAAIHWEAKTSFSEMHPDVDVVEEIFVLDEKIFTAAGGTAALDMMLHIIWDRQGYDLVAAVAEQFIYGEIRGKTSDQRMTQRSRLMTTNKHLIKAVEIMNNSINTHRSISSIASESGLSLRSLERLFKTQLNTTPKRYFLRKKLNHARRLLRQTEMSVLEVSVATGFSSASLFSRVYTNFHGTPPSQDRHLEHNLYR